MKATSKKAAGFSANILTAFLLASVLFTGCEADQNQQLESREWQLVWSDDFDGAAGQAPDPAKWAYDLGRGTDGWGNQEFQTYTDDPANVSLDGNGNLVITARKEGASFTSARINTKGLFDQAYGRFEARMKTPYGPGIWPAFWMMGANIDQVGWPQCGEIDVMELRGQHPEKCAGGVHGPGYSAGGAVAADYTLEDGRFDSDFHVFAIEWQENQLDFFVDDFLYQRITPADVPGEWVYDHPFFLIFNVAVGGNYVGFPTSQTPFPQTLEIDFVRVYQ